MDHRMVALGGGECIVTSEASSQAAPEPPTGAQVPNQRDMTVIPGGRSRTALAEPAPERKKPPLSTEALGSGGSPSTVGELEKGPPRPEPRRRSSPGATDSVLVPRHRDFGRSE